MPPPACLRRLDRELAVIAHPGEHFFDLCAPGGGDELDVPCEIAAFGVEPLPQAGGKGRRRRSCAQPVEDPQQAQRLVAGAEEVGRRLEADTPCRGARARPPLPAVRGGHRGGRRAEPFELASSSCERSRSGSPVPRAARMRARVWSMHSSRVSSASRPGSSLPCRRRSSTSSTWWVKSAIAVKPRLPAAPLIECTPRKIALRRSGVGSSFSSCSRSLSVASSRSRLSAKKLS